MSIYLNKVKKKSFGRKEQIVVSDSNWKKNWEESYGLTQCLEPGFGNRDLDSNADPAPS